MDSTWKWTPYIGAVSLIIVVIVASIFIHVIILILAAFLCFFLSYVVPMITGLDTHLTPKEVSAETNEKPEQVEMDYDYEEDKTEVIERIGRSWLVKTKHPEGDNPIEDGAGYRILYGSGKYYSPIPALLLIAGLIFIASFAVAIYVLYP